MEKLYKLFDRDGDGLLSSTDFADTINGLDSEAMMKLRTRSHQGFRTARHLRLCKTPHILPLPDYPLTPTRIPTAEELKKTTL